ncbi:MAG: hypothetical protein MI784_03720 [Cytophagales bacterium]|nr:hypothetical protein [Cytophagales bacterium]
MDFLEYLLSKKIDAKAFREGDASLWESFERDFQHMHPSSFTARKLYHINGLRLKYPLAPEAAEKSEIPKKKAVRPKINRKP